jgi:hypothetical protein
LTEVSIIDNIEERQSREYPVKRSTALLETVLAAAMALVLMGLVLAPLLGPSGLSIIGGPRLVVEATLSDPVTDRSAVRDGSTVDLSGLPRVEASLRDPSLDQRLGLLGGRLLTGLTALGVLGLLLQVVRSLRRDEVFARVNARRLTRLAVLLGVGGTAAQLLTAFGTVRVLDSEFMRGSVTPVFELSFFPLFGALGVGVLAEVFRQGAGLREDIEGLV